MSPDKQCDHFLHEREEEEKIMNELSEFEQHFYKNFASKFVELYLDFSKHEASVYAVEHVRQENMSLAKPFVDEEFEKRGYTV